MKSTLVFLCLASIVSAQIIAQAIIKGTANDINVNGKVTFTQTAGSNVTVSVALYNITFFNATNHGLHVHFWGDLSDSTGSLSTGTHWTNAAHTVHACPEAGANRHLGDMGNWEVVNGAIVQTKVLDLLTLSGVDSIIGRAVVLHGYPDDCATQPNGLSATRLAHGVIGIVNSTVYGGTTFASTDFNATYAIVNLEAATANVTGTVWLTQSNATAGVFVQAIIYGITGQHGFHLHWWGDISLKNGTATGLHFNPYNSLHGVPANPVRHLGDMGIIYHYKAGVAYYSYFNDYLSLSGPNNVVGRAIHVHANGDSCVNPIGDGGSRWAQGVVGITVPHNLTLLTQLFSDVPTVQNGTIICGNLVSTSATTAVATTATTVVGTGTTATTVVATTRVNGTASRASTQGDSPASMVSVAWALLAIAFAFCL